MGGNLQSQNPSPNSIIKKKLEPDSGSHFEPFHSQMDSSGTDSSSESTTSIPAPSAGILMLSLPDSLDDYGAQNDDKNSADQDVFETPPEYALAGTSQEKTPLFDLDQIGQDDEDRDYEGVGEIGDGSGVIAAVCGCGGDGDGAVDLGRDTDFTISEAESVEFRVLKRDLSVSSAESWPPSKKLRASEDDLVNSEEELETEPLSLSNLGSDSDHTLEIAGDDAKSVEESSGKKKVENSGSESENGTQGIQQVSEESGSASGVEYSFQEDCEIDSRDSQSLRVLPLSSPGDSSRMQAKEGEEWSRLLEMVKFVKDITCKEDNEVEKCSILEIAKRHSMTFPRL